MQADHSHSVIENLLDKYSKHVKALSTIAIIITSSIAIAGGYVWYRSNIWKPTIEIISVDFTNAVCHLLINGTEKTLYGNSTLAAGATWGVRFGTTSQAGNEYSYDTIELVKDDRVYEIYKVHDQPVIPASSATV